MIGVLASRGECEGSRQGYAVAGCSLASQPRFRRVRSSRGVVRDIACLCSSTAAGTSHSVVWAFRGVDTFLLAVPSVYELRKQPALMLIIRYLYIT